MFQLHSVPVSAVSRDTRATQMSVAVDITLRLVMS